MSSHLRTSHNTCDVARVCAEIVFRCLYVARIGRPDLSWTVNILARSVNNWNKDHDKGLAIFISYIIHTKTLLQYCFVGDNLEDCRLGLFQNASST